jgi:hypothetical protein
MQAMNDPATAAQVTAGLDLRDRQIQACVVHETGQVFAEVRIVTP